MREHFLIGLLIVALIPLALYFRQFHYGLSTQPQDWGDFGNLFAGITSLLALVAILFSLQTTKAQFKKQSEDTIFFNLLNVHIEKVKNISIVKEDEGKESSKEGYFAFQEFVSLINQKADEHLFDLGRLRYINDPRSISSAAAFIFATHLRVYEKLSPDKALKDISPSSQEEKNKVVEYLLKFEGQARNERVDAVFRLSSWGEEEKEKAREELKPIGSCYFNSASIQDKSKSLREIFDSFYKDYSPFYGHYFRNMHHTLRYIRKTENEDEYKKIYRAQLSRFEIAALFYNYMSAFAGPEFVKNVYDMKMFDNGIYRPDIFFNPSQEVFEALIKDRYEQRKQYSGSEQ